MYSVLWALFMGKLGQLNYNELELRLNGGFTPEQDNKTSQMLNLCIPMMPFTPVLAGPLLYWRRTVLEEDWTGGGNGLVEVMDWRWSWTGGGGIMTACMAGLTVDWSGRLVDVMDW